MFGRTIEKKAVWGTSHGRQNNKVSLGIACYHNFIVMQAETSQGLRHACCRTEIELRGRNVWEEEGKNLHHFSCSSTLKYLVSDSYQP